MLVITKNVINDIGQINIMTIDHFTVVGLVTWPPNSSEAGGDLVLIQTSLILLCEIYMK